MDNTSGTVQLTVCRLFSAKPLAEPVMTGIIVLINAGVCILQLDP